MQAGGGGLCDLVARHEAVVGAHGAPGCYAKRWTKASAVSATSRQPLAMVRAWPRLGISTISVTPSVRCCFVEGVRDRPPHGVVLFTGDDQQRTSLGVLTIHLRFGPWIEVAVAAWNSGAPEADTANSSYNCLASSSLTALAKL
jgi:hypothetical protein